MCRQVVSGNSLALWARPITGGGSRCRDTKGKRREKRCKDTFYCNRNAPACSAERSESPAATLTQCSQAEKWLFLRVFLSYSVLRTQAHSHAPLCTRAHTFTRTRSVSASLSSPHGSEHHWKWQWEFGPICAKSAFNDEQHCWTKELWVCKASSVRARVCACVCLPFFLPLRVQFASTNFSTRRHTLEKLAKSNQCSEAGNITPSLFSSHALIFPLPVGGWRWEERRRLLAVRRTRSIVTCVELMRI